MMISQAHKRWFNLLNCIGGFMAEKVVNDPNRPARDGSTEAQRWLSDPCNL
ncbi:hypothetical protein LguiB_003077 [Lonicera macranthoides]